MYSRRKDSGNFKGFRCCPVTGTIGGGRTHQMARILNSKSDLNSRNLQQQLCRMNDDSNHSLFIVFLNYIVRVQQDTSQEERFFGSQLCREGEWTHNLSPWLYTFFFFFFCILQSQPYTILYSRKNWQFGGLSSNCQLKSVNHRILLYIWQSCTKPQNTNIITLYNHEQCLTSLLRLAPENLFCKQRERERERQK